MTFEDLDNNFEKIAKTPIKTDVQRTTDAADAAETEKTKYEDEIGKKATIGLLALFEKNLIEKMKHKEVTGKSDEKFETIEIDSSAVIPESPSNQPEVSEEDIDSLLNKERYGDTFEQVDTQVEQTLTEVQRYDEVVQSPNNVVEVTPPTQQPNPNNPTPQGDPVPYTQRGIDSDQVDNYIATHRSMKKTQGNTETIISFKGTEEQSD